MNGQTLVIAKYRVRGIRAKEMERFLIENYRMGKLKWSGTFGC